MSDAKVRTCLWFNKDGEEAARFYVSLLPDSRIESVVPSPGDWPAGKAGEAIVIDFTLGGTPYQILNGGPEFQHSEAASISVITADQAETDRLWAALTANGGKEVQCGWLRDRYGLSWQIVPEVLMRSLSHPDRAAAKRAFEAMTAMVKIDVARIEAALAGR